MNFTHNIPVRGKPSKKIRLCSSSDSKFVITLADQTRSSYSLFIVNGKSFSFRQYACKSAHTQTVYSDMHDKKTDQSIQNWDRDFPGKNWLNDEPGPNFRPGFLFNNFSSR